MKIENLENRTQELNAKVQSYIISSNEVVYSDNIKADSVEASTGIKTNFANIATSEIEAITANAIHGSNICTEYKANFENINFQNTIAVDSRFSELHLYNTTFHGNFTADSVDTSSIGYVDLINCNSINTNIISAHIDELNLKYNVETGEIQFLYMGDPFYEPDPSNWNISTADELETNIIDAINSVIRLNTISNRNFRNINFIIDNITVNNYSNEATYNNLFSSDSVILYSNVLTTDNLNIQLPNNGYLATDDFSYDWSNIISFNYDYNQYTYVYPSAMYLPRMVSGESFINICQEVNNLEFNNVVYNNYYYGNNAKNNIINNKQNNFYKRLNNFKNDTDFNNWINYSPYYNYATTWNNLQNICNELKHIENSTYKICNRPAGSISTLGAFKYFDVAFNRNVPENKTLVTNETNYNNVYLQRYSGSNGLFQGYNVNNNIAVVSIEGYIWSQENLSNYFNNCTSLVYARNYIPLNCKDVSNMFNNCQNFVGQVYERGIGFNSPTITNLDCMFYNCRNLNTNQFSVYNIITHNALTARRMFVNAFRRNDYSNTKTKYHHIDIYANNLVNATSIFENSNITNSTIVANGNLSNLYAAYRNSGIMEVNIQGLADNADLHNIFDNRRADSNYIMHTSININWHKINYYPQSLLSSTFITDSEFNFDCNNWINNIGGSTFQPVFNNVQVSIDVNLILENIPYSTTSNLLYVTNSSFTNVTFRNLNKSKVNQFQYIMRNVNIDETLTIADSSINILSSNTVFLDNVKFKTLKLDNIINGGPGMQWFQTYYVSNIVYIPGNSLYWRPRGYIFANMPYLYEAALFNSYQDEQNNIDTIGIINCPNLKTVVTQGYKMRNIILDNLSNDQINRIHFNTSSFYLGNLSISNMNIEGWNIFNESNKLNMNLNGVYNLKISNISFRERYFYGYGNSMLMNYFPDIRYLHMNVADQSLSRMFDKFNNTLSVNLYVKNNHAVRAFANMNFVIVDSLTTDYCNTSYMFYNSNVYIKNNINLNNSRYYNYMFCNANIYIVGSDLNICFDTSNASFNHTFANLKTPTIKTEPVRIKFLDTDNDSYKDDNEAKYYYGNMFMDTNSYIRIYLNRNWRNKENFQNTILLYGNNKGNIIPNLEFIYY